MLMCSDTNESHVSTFAITGESSKNVVQLFNAKVVALIQNLSITSLTAFTISNSIVTLVLKGSNILNSTSNLS
jgi:hypothetical protein